MDMEFLASRVQAANMPGKLSWWTRHGEHSLRLIFSGGRQGSIERDQSVALTHACTWEAWMPKGISRRFMDRHIAYEVALVEAAYKGASSTIHRLEDLLVSNAYQQSDELGLKIKDFPVQRFRNLVLDHTWLFTRQMRHLLERRSGIECANKAQANAVTLGAFSVEWF